MVAPPNEEAGQNCNTQNEISEAPGHASRFERGVVFDTTARLPPEILTMVFRYCKRPRRRLEHIFAEPNLEWIRVTFVCRSWRQIALGCPSLWGDCLALSRSVDCVQTMLTRSQEAPLQLNGTVVTSNIALVIHILQHLPRMFQISLEMTPAHALPVFETMRVRPAPLLKRCDLIVLLRAEINEYIPEGIFQSYAPRLENLVITGFSVGNMTSSIYTGLRKLSIRGRDVNSGPSWSQFLAALNNCPQLESLAVRHAIPLLDHNNHHSVSKKVELPLLRLLSIDDSLSTASYFASHLECPASLVLDICLNISPDHTIAELQDLFAPLLKPILHHSAPALEKMEIRDPSDRCEVFISAYAAGKEVAKVEIVLLFELQFDLESLQKSLVALCRQLPLQHLVSLEVNCIFLGAKDWYAAFGQAKHLRSIKATGLSGFWLVVLTGGELPLDDVEGNTADNEPELVFPNLSDITLDHIDLTNPTLQKDVDLIPYLVNWHEILLDRGPPFSWVKMENLSNVDAVDLSPLRDAGIIIA
jgi:hypothetical protein